MYSPVLSKGANMASTVLSAPQIVELFLNALAQQDQNTVANLLASDLEYSNVSLPTIYGSETVSKLFAALAKLGMGFEVKTHHIACTGEVVMTERTDILSYKNFRVSFWVCGTFIVRNGQIVVWRDHFDWMSLSKGTLLGFMGIILPQFRAVLPQ